MAYFYYSALRPALSRLVGTWGASRPAASYWKLLAGITPLLLLSGWFSPALAGQVQLAWNATTTHTDGTPATDLAGYHLYYWQGSTGTPQNVNVGNTTTYTLTGLVDGGTYSFAVAAYNTSGQESSNSNTITATVPSVNHAPLALADTASATSGTPVTIAVLANDTDPDGNPFTLTGRDPGGPWDGHHQRLQRALYPGGRLRRHR